MLLLVMAPIKAGTINPVAPKMFKYYFSQKYSSWSLIILSVGLCDQFDKGPSTLFKVI